jgi:hypothetical protein
MASREHKPSHIHPRSLAAVKYHASPTMRQSLRDEVCLLLPNAGTQNESLFGEILFVERGIPRSNLRSESSS